MDNTPGERIRIAREALGWTQAVVAEKLGITIGTLSGYERNYRKPNLDMLRKLVTVLGVSADFILGLTDTLSNKECKDPCKLKLQFRSDRLLNLRKQKGLSQAELAQYLDVRQSLVSYYESGSKQPGYETLAKMADLFSVSVEYLLGLTDNPHGTHLLDIASVNKITGTVAKAIITNPSLLESYQDFFEREDLQLIHEYLCRLKPETIQKLLEVVKLINDSKQE